MDWVLREEDFPSSGRELPYYREMLEQFANVPQVPVEKQARVAVSEVTPVQVCPVVKCPRTVVPVARMVRKQQRLYQYHEVVQRIRFGRT